MQYSTEPRTKKFVKRYGCLSFAKNLSNKYKTELLTKGLDSLKIAFK